jgi:uncharacterized protein (TIGR02246 family)
MQTEPTTVVEKNRKEEQAIRDLTDAWLAASKRGDLETMLELLADDVLFITPGKEPFGKEAFANANAQMKDLDMDAKLDIREIQVTGDWAWMRSFLNMTMTPRGGNAMKHSGHILTILRKNADGRWVIARDANFVAPEK